MPHSLKQIRVALIGCGVIAKTHLEAIKKVPSIELVMVCDPDEAAARAMALSHPCCFSIDSKEVFQDSGIDAVLICAPPAFHYDLTRQAMLAGKHVLCEKPFTVSLRQALRIKKLSKKSNRLVEMASKFRFVPDVIQAKKFIESGAIGDVVMSEVIFCSIVNMKRRWNSNPKISGGGVLIDNGSHAVDVIRYLVGPIKSVYAQVGRKTQKIPVEDTARLHFETKKKVIGMVDLSWSLYKNTDIYVNVFGTKGTIEVGWTKSVIWNSQKKTSRVFGGGYRKLDAFVNQLRHFSDCIRKKAKPILGIDDAVESVRAIDAAYTSIRESRWLEVNS